jgi:SAM-dependent methyltransferase
MSAATGNVWDEDRPTPIDGIAGGPTAARIASALRDGAVVRDDHFDRFLPHDLRQLSAQYWTPIEVARRVAMWLRQLPVRTVVDIGSGAGKFCVATALATECEFIGLEHRPRLVAAAAELARSFGVEERVRFHHHVVGDAPVPQADAYYIFNPFEENDARFQGGRIDDDVEASVSRYESEVSSTRKLLDELPVGSSVIKYNGYGGLVPDSFDVLDVDRELPCVLRLWQKTHDSRGV